MYVHLQIGAVLGVLPLVIMLVSLTVFKDLMRSIREDLQLMPMESAKTVEKSCKKYLYRVVSNIELNYVS